MRGHVPCCFSYTLPQARIMTVMLFITRKTIHSGPMRAWIVAIMAIHWREDWLTTKWKKIASICVYAERRWKTTTASVAVKVLWRRSIWHPYSSCASINVSPTGRHKSSLDTPYFRRLLPLHYPEQQPRWKLVALDSLLHCSLVTRTLAENELY